MSVGYVMTYYACSGPDYAGLPRRRIEYGIMSLSTGVGWFRLIGHISERTGGRGVRAL